MFIEPIDKDFKHGVYLGQTKKPADLQRTSLPVKGLRWQRPGMRPDVEGKGCIRMYTQKSCIRYFTNKLCF